MSPRVFIFEEHHEVLEAWFAEFEAKRLVFPVTVLHIDAHADLALPRPHPQVPAFHWPHSRDQLAALMQKNDVFLLASAVGRMLNRIVWITPSWLSQRPTNGRLRLGHVSNESESRFCLCGPGPGCAAEGQEGEYEIVAACEVEAEISFEAVREDEAKLPPLPTAGALVLDIDEDFFGVQSVASSLLSVGISAKELERLQNALSRLPEGLTEAAADCLFRSMLRCAAPQGPDCPAAARLPAALGALMARYSAAQREALAEVGLCLNVSPRTFLAVHGAARPHLELCLGVVRPRGSHRLHNPDPADLRRRLRRFEALLRAMPRPALVTISRSARDGFVPRALRPQIEAGVRAALSRTFRLGPEDFRLDRKLWRAWSCGN